MQTVTSPNYAWTLQAYEEQGNLYLQWSDNAPFRAQQGQIHVYSSQSFPSNPQDNTKAWTWDNASNSPWNTKLPYGSDWYCAYIAEAPSNGPYTYVVKLVTNGQGATPQAVQEASATA